MDSLSEFGERSVEHLTSLVRRTAPDGSPELAKAPGTSPRATPSAPPQAPVGEFFATDIAFFATDIAVERRGVRSSTYGIGFNNPCRRGRTTPCGTRSRRQWRCVSRCSLSPRSLDISEWLGPVPSCCNSAGSVGEAPIAMFSRLKPRTRKAFIGQARNSSPRRNGFASRIFGALSTRMRAKASEPCRSRAFVAYLHVRCAALAGRWAGPKARPSLRFGSSSTGDRG